MNVIIKQGMASGVVHAPPSKSYAHRMLIGAALAQGVSTIRGVAFSEDILATMDCIRRLGADCCVSGDEVTVTGCGGHPRATDILPCRESGSTLRFLIPVALLGGGETVFSGTERLFARGIDTYRTMFGSRAIRLTAGRSTLTAAGTLPAGDYSLSGAVSSQFVSGMLFALPLAVGDSILTVTEPVESRSYIGMTLDAVRRCGVRIKETAPNTFFIPGGQHYLPLTAVVEGDWSNAAFLYALNYAGGQVSVEGVESGSLQGDRVCLNCFTQMEKGFAHIDLSDCPDLGPVLFTVAALLHGAEFTGTRRLSIKESDRAAVMTQELHKCGIRVAVEENSVTVFPGTLQKPQTALCGHNDHRVVMSMSLLAVRTGAVIEGAEAVKKSFPDFFSVLRGLGLEVKEQ